MQIEKISKTCLWCKSPLLKRSAIKYCNVSCQHNFLYMNNFLDWYFELSNVFSNRMLRFHLETIYGHKCSNCQITNWRGFDIVFDVDHISGDSSDNSPGNVRLLCQNCHSQTETHSKNKGMGRHSLKQKRLKNKNESE